MTQDREFIALNIAVLTVSDSRDESNDKSGALLVKQLTDGGHQLAEKTIVPEALIIGTWNPSNAVSVPGAISPSTAIFSMVRVGGSVCWPSTMDTVNSRQTAMSR